MGQCFGGVDSLELRRYHQRGKLFGKLLLHEQSHLGAVDAWHFGVLFIFSQQKSLIKMLGDRTGGALLCDGERQRRFLINLPD